MNKIIEEVRQAAGLTEASLGAIAKALADISGKLQMAIRAKGLRIIGVEKSVTSGGPDEMINVKHDVETDPRAAGYDPKAMEQLVQGIMKALARYKPHQETSRKTMDGHEWLYSIGKGKMAIGVEIAHDDQGYLSFHVFEL